MAEEFKTPQPGDWVDIEIPGGWDVLYAPKEQQPALTDERILAIAERHRNHLLTAPSGTRFDVIEHGGLVAFAREIERAMIRQQVSWRVVRLRVIAPPSPVHTVGTASH